MPYVGNKGQIAQQIIDLLPSGNRFYDVFGGGGSMSFHALASKKYKTVFYNDKQENVVEALQAVLAGDIDFAPFLVPKREKFNWYKDQPDSVEKTIALIAWSFSNDCKSFLWGRKIEDLKALASAALFYPSDVWPFEDLYSYAKGSRTIAEAYRCYHQWRKDKLQQLDKIANLKNLDQITRLKQLEQLPRLQQLERLKQLQQLQNLQQLQKLEKDESLLAQLTFQTNDYRDLSFKADDVVYCDPPYVGTKYQYGGFDNDAFVKWYSCLPVENVYISNYSVLPNTQVVGTFKKHSFTAKGKRRAELLLRVVK
ncbi:DNA adenine methylase [Loigolactobacillus rennini]|uniref:site-specific DNA-methyltransferase (adenine-specific) n=1 Tax=Loigolactobacillus rennini DSM 20253 TaxID=1423796 RepID=A0A0R2CU35_9LACO|nr:DNA adenine methylase [Loigolactobacillus rennini]KRM95272.1 phage protein [Loigolactobacillus rennini DSM 20253]